MPVEITVDLSRVSAKPPLQALADVTLRWTDGEIIVRRCAVFRKPGEPPWVSLPRLSIEKNGRKTYLPLIEIPQGLKQSVFKAVLEEFRKLANDT
jgi:hypothetical protein